jgi:hypothetical protein
MQNLLAICYDKNNKEFRYRRIFTQMGSLENFENYCKLKKFTFINYYDRSTNKLIKQIKL